MINIIDIKPREAAGCVTTRDWYSQTEHGEKQDSRGTQGRNSFTKGKFIVAFLLIYIVRSIFLEWYIVVFSSPEPLGSQGELIGWP